MSNSGKTISKQQFQSYQKGGFARILSVQHEDDSPEYWNELVAKADCSWHTVDAEIPGKLRVGMSGARDFDCSDTKVYVVKPPQRANIAEHVVARIGAVIQAPVANIALVKISQELIEAEPNIANFRLGVTHGSEYVPLLRDSRGVNHTTEPENRTRFARLALLDALTFAGDRQYLYSNTKPHLVYSADHGYYFPQDYRWSSNSLLHNPVPHVSEEMAVNATLTNDLLCEASQFLERLTDQEIINIVFTVPDSWGTYVEEKLALAKWLSSRRDRLMSRYIMY